jgi:AhpD family alkylhydroperoxidase
MATSRSSKAKPAGKPARRATPAAARRRKPAARKTRRARPAAGIGPNRKPTISTREAVARLAALMSEFQELYAIWGKSKLDPAFREELMVAVARQNDAPYCSWMHRTWAELAGSSREVIEKIELLDPRGLDARKWAAVAYVRALASNDMKPVSGQLRRRVEAHFSQREIDDIELVARAMDLINRMANTFDAMVSRLQGKPAADSDILDEVVFSGLFAALAPPLVLALARYARRPFLEMARGLVDHVQPFYAQTARRG